jgi:hypothetical protein
MKTINLMAVLFTALLLTVSFNSNSYGSEAESCECCDATCEASGCCSNGSGSAQKNLDCCSDQCTDTGSNECCTSGNCTTNKSGGNSETAEELSGKVENTCTMSKSDSEVKTSDCCK